jgi:thiamine-phosphate pyrophosphorylase
MSQLPQTDIYAITDSTLSLGRGVEEVVAALLAADVKIIQYREKKKKAGEMLRECEAIRAMTKRAGAFFIVNDHIDIVMLVGADGVHVGQDDIPVEKVRTLVGPDCVIGLSTHSPEQAAAAITSGADYIGVGPLYATQTKEDVCDPVGLVYLEYVVKNLSVPFVAIGGIKRHNIGEVVNRGAKCCCLVSELVGAENIGARVAEVRNAMKG